MGGGEGVARCVPVVKVNFQNENIPSGTRVIVTRSPQTFMINFLRYNYHVNFSGKFNYVQISRPHPQKRGFLKFLARG